MKTIPAYILAWRRIAMFYYIAVALWRCKIAEYEYPLVVLPTWAVHYMARYMYLEEGDDMEYADIVDYLKDEADKEWDVRRRFRNHNRKYSLKTRV
jgi:hypothetical protein